MGARWLESDEGQEQLARLRANDPGLVEAYLFSNVVGPNGAAVLGEARKGTHRAVMLL